MKTYDPSAITAKMLRFVAATLCFVLLIHASCNAQSGRKQLPITVGNDSQVNDSREVQRWNKIIQYAPAMAAAWHLRGIAKYRMGDYRGAIADQQQAAILEPANEQVYLAAAYARLALKQYRAAVQALSHAIAINPVNTATWYHRGFIWQQLGQTNKARFDFSRANELGLETAKDKLMGFDPE